MTIDGVIAGERPLIKLTTTVNGRPVSATIAPNLLLLDFLRGQLGLTGAKKSCDVQVCGACTVLLDGLPVSACTTLAYEARNRAVLTIEGLGTPERLHPLQEAFVQHTGLQCGFCTPGMVLSAYSLLQENPHPTREEIVHHLHGSLCRCTGYWHIIEAVEAAAQRMAGQGASHE